MQTLLWIVSTALMLTLLGLIALRALAELLGVKARLPVPGKNRSAARLSPAYWPRPLLFLTPLVILWLGAFFGYAVLAGRPDGFLRYFWERFTTAGDGYYYKFIAENGYVSSGENVNAIVFYPLYPLLMRCLGTLLGGRTALAGLLISQICCGLSSVVLAELAKKECPHPGAALAAYWLYPFGFFCLGVFTEGLFLLLAILGLYLLRERRWLWAWLAGALCALTRTQGILLLLPGVYCAWRDCREKKRWSWKYLAAAGPLLGFGVYLCVNKAVCGSFFAYQYYESIEPWWQTPQWLGDTIAQQLDMILQFPDIADWIYWPQLVLYFVAAALLLAGYRRKLDTAWLLYGTGYLGMCYTASWLISGGRYMLGCVPLYLIVGRLKSPGLRALILLAELVLLAVYSYFYMQAQAIM